MTTAVPATLPNGKRIHFRSVQSILWGALAAVLGAGFIAGLYFGPVEMNWFGHSLKEGWDHLFSQSWWPVYRHEVFRNIPEPAFATMGVLTLMAKPKYWGKHVGKIRLLTAPVILVLLTFALGIAGTRLVNFAAPTHAHWDIGRYHWYLGNWRAALAWHAVGNLALGIAIGKFVLHPFWAPVGATLQGKLLDDKADVAARTGRIPLWVRWPLSPPVIRERFTVMFNERHHVYQGAPRKRPWLVFAMTLVFALITALGLIAHYWIGTGHTFPFITTG